MIETAGVDDPGEQPPDEGARRVLRELGVPAAALLGCGGEALVHALDDERVVRVLRADGEADLGARARLVDELRRTHRGFELPQTLELGAVGSRHYAIERRLSGRSVAVELQSLDRRSRDRLIVDHLDAAAALGDLRLDRRDYFGDLIAPNPVRSETWRGYLVDKVAASLAVAPGFENVDAESLARDLPDCGEGSFVHLDAFAGNMLATGGTVTAVIDIGTTSVVGDRRLDPLSAAVYFCAEPITPEADDADRLTAHAWLDAAHLTQWFEPARRWLAGYWARAVADENLHGWCRDVVL